MPLLTSLESEDKTSVNHPSRAKLEENPEQPKQENPNSNKKKFAEDAKSEELREAGQEVSETGVKNIIIQENEYENSDNSSADELDTKI